MRPPEPRRTRPAEGYHQGYYQANPRQGEPAASAGSNPPLPLPAVGTGGRAPRPPAACALFGMIAALWAGQRPTRRAASILRQRPVKSPTPLPNLLGYCMFVVEPKVAKFRAKWAAKLIK